jgi:hypothetical protein
MVARSGEQAEQDQARQNKANARPLTPARTLV